jgi:hypothetical protein
MRTTTGLPGTSQRNDGYAEARDGSAKKAGPAMVPPAAPEISRNRVFHRDCKGTDRSFTSNLSYRLWILLSAEMSSTVIALQYEHFIVTLDTTSLLLPFTVSNLHENTYN